jgi:hypothetical protein
MPRFALLCHDAPRGWHCDFFLERGDVLRTWELPSLPEIGKTVPAEPLADHRLLYLDYEGPISGDRGMVTRWDRGDYEVVAFEDTLVHVKLSGTKLTGEVILQRSSKELKEWKFVWTV